MALRKPNSIFKVQEDLQDYQLDRNTNFVLREITLETLDAAMWQEFNKRFTVANKQLNLINLDSDIASMRYENPQQFDEKKGYLNLPYFTIWRTKTSPFSRTSPSNKPLIYAIPKQKAQGVVIEEYIMNPPILQKLQYDLTFITTYRHYVNELEQQMTDYFKNKRTSLNVEGEKFQLQPATQFDLGNLTVVDREGESGLSLYTVVYKLELLAYTRNLKDIQKRERPNTFTLSIKEQGNKNLIDKLETKTELRNNEE